MENKKWYGQIITDCEGPPQCVTEKEFETEAEAKAYMMGANDAIEHVSPEFDLSDDYWGIASTQPSIVPDETAQPVAEESDDGRE